MKELYKHCKITSECEDVLVNSSTPIGKIIAFHANFMPLNSLNYLLSKPQQESPYSISSPKYESEIRSNYIMLHPHDHQFTLIWIHDIG